MMDAKLLNLSELLYTIQDMQAYCKILRSNRHWMEEMGIYFVYNV